LLCIRYANINPNVSRDMIL